MYSRCSIITEYIIIRYYSVITICYINHHLDRITEKDMIPSMYIVQYIMFIFVIFCNTHIYRHIAILF